MRQNFKFRDVQMEVLWIIDKYYFLLEATERKKLFIYAAICVKDWIYICIDLHFSTNVLLELDSLER